MGVWVWGGLPLDFRQVAAVPARLVHVWWDGEVCVCVWGVGCAWEMS